VTIPHATTCHMPRYAALTFLCDSARNIGRFDDLEGRR
jgi:hypothetical protein